MAGEASYCVTLVILTVSVTVWVVTTDPEVPVATTVTWEELGVTLATYPFIPQPDRPAVRAQTPASNRQRCQRRCVFTNFRLRAKTARLVRPPGHQNTNANTVGLNGLCGASGGTSLPACCIVVLMVSPVLTFW